MGFDTNDDAGVYLVNPELAVVSTVDFITPPVDDPFIFGQIAAANSLSDIYAMGGTPFGCLNLVGFPSDKLGPEVLARIPVRHNHDHASRCRLWRRRRCRLW